MGGSADPRDAALARWFNELAARSNAAFLPPFFAEHR